MPNMILIMVNECGEEIECEKFNIGEELDSNYLELWKMQKIDKYREEYPEARNFYFEDRRNWKSEIFSSMYYGIFE